MVSMGVGANSSLHPGKSGSFSHLSFISIVSPLFKFPDFRTEDNKFVLPDNVWSLESLGERPEQLVVADFVLEICLSFNLLSSR